MQKSKVGGMPPPASSSGGGFRDWDAIAEKLKENPGTPVLLPGFIQTPKVEALQIQVNYSTPPKALRALGGEVKGYIRNSMKTDDDGRIGDLWLIWTPEGMTPTEGASDGE